jgi:hypothetical protein
MVARLASNGIRSDMGAVRGEESRTVKASTRSNALALRLVLPTRSDDWLRRPALTIPSDDWLRRLGLKAMDDESPREGECVKREGDKSILTSAASPNSCTSRPTEAGFMPAVSCGSPRGGPRGTDPSSSIADESWLCLSMVGGERLSVSWRGGGCCNKTASGKSPSFCNVVRTRTSRVGATTVGWDVCCILPTSSERAGWSCTAFCCETGCVNCLLRHNTLENSLLRGLANRGNLPLGNESGSNLRGHREGIEA